MKEKKNNELSYKKIEKIRLYSYSDMIFFWPTPIISLILAVFSIIPFFQIENVLNLFSWIWIIVFTYNIFIVAFDFSSTKTFAIVALFVGLILLTFIILFTTGWNALTVFLFLNTLSLNLRWEFYTVMASSFGLIILIMIISTRINYVEITSNRVFVKKGIFSDKFDLSTGGMQVEKQINDVFEYLFLRSGDINLVFQPGSKFPILLPSNVINVNKKIDQINLIISQEEVDIL